MRSDALARRKRIITAACEVFQTQPEPVPLELIAERAQVGIATLYRNFPDRAALLHACGAQFFEQAIDLQHQILAEFDDNPDRAWWDYARGLVGMGLAHLVSTFAPENLEVLPEDVKQLRATAQKFGQQIMDKAHAHGQLASPVAHNSFVLGLITVTRPPVKGILALEPNITTWLVEVYLKGLKATAS